MSPAIVIPGPARDAADDGLRAAVSAVLGNETGWRNPTGRRLVAEAAGALGEADDTVSYLLLACLQHQIPRESEIVAFTRAWRLEGLEAPLTLAYEAAATRLLLSRLTGQPMRVIVESGVVVDVTETSRSRFTTGIQRVTREAISRWVRDHDHVTLGVWSPGGERLGAISDTEIPHVVLDEKDRGRVAWHGHDGRGGVVIVPFRATFVLPEITTWTRRTQNIQTIARFSGSRAVAVGHDVIPVTTAETSGPGMPGAFSKYMAALARFDQVASVSSASSNEYRGWREMLAGAGMTGPEVTVVPLPRQSAPVSDETVERVRRELGLGDGRPTVLAVGSHEPRKNHLNLLTAAELRWRAGDEFHLVMVGGNAWGDHEFKLMVDDLRRAGRSISLLSGVDDDTVWSLYRIARFSAFCSINEGFGLPVVESLTSGTPVVTSDFGSMRELGEGNGALIVDPHDIQAIADALGRLLEDDGLLAELVGQTETIERTSWDDYASALWTVATGS